MDLLVIDEVSMVRPDLLDAIDHTMRRFKNPFIPFGGVQLLLIGDLRQLSPVVRPEDWEIMKEHYSSPYFFESKALRDAGFATVGLSTVYRQTDTQFVNLLNAVRDGSVTERQLEILNSRYNPAFSPGTDDGYIRLTTHNNRADSINLRSLQSLPDKEKVYCANISGKFPETSFPAEEKLALKKNAQVMFLRNGVSDGRQFYNGMIGTVTELTDTNVTVQPADGSEPIIVGKQEWENTRYTIDESTREVKQETEGKFSQLPLRLAWAITIHKSQGLTFDKAIIDAARSFAPGQTYVAHSRCRSLEGIVLDSPIPRSAIITDPIVNSFLDYCRDNAVKPEQIQGLKERYNNDILCQIFDFKQLQMLFEDFSRAVQEHVAPINPGLSRRYIQAEAEMDTKIVAVGRKFAAIYTSVPEAALSQQVMDKINSGCRYFLDSLNPIDQLLKDTPKKLDNAKKQARVLNSYRALRYEWSLKTSLLKTFSHERFSTKAYSMAKSKALLELEKPTPVQEAFTGNRTNGNRANSAQTGRKERETAKKPKGYSAYETLKLYNAGKTIADIARERKLSAVTVANHLAQMITRKELSIDRVISPEHLALFKETYALRDTPGFAPAYERLKKKVSASELAIWVRVYQSAK